MGLLYRTLMMFVTGLGSGYAIAVEALGAVMRAEDGRGPPTALTRAILTHLRLESPQDIIK